MIRGCLILLLLTAAAILCHNIDISPSSGPLDPNLMSHVSGLSAEQKFLLSGPVDINTATTEDLIAIPRIGPSLAKRLIEFRTVRGPIHSLDELLEVKGIGPRILESIRPYLKTR